MNNLLNIQISKKDKEIHYECDIERFENILAKLAIGHVAYEFDYIDIDCEMLMWYDWSFNLSNNEIQEFNAIPTLDIMPEVGSRSSSKIAMGISENGKLVYFFEWVHVENGMYRYLVYFDENNNVSVKIAICDLLFCIVKF